MAEIFGDFKADKTATDHDCMSFSGLLCMGFDAVHVGDRAKGENVIVVDTRNRRADGSAARSEQQDVIRFLIRTVGRCHRYRFIGGSDFCNLRTDTDIDIVSRLEPFGCLKNEIVPFGDDFSDMVG